jgi:hypothetical protein
MLADKSTLLLDIIDIGYFNNLINETLYGFEPAILLVWY